MIISQFIEKILSDHELGYQKNLCNRLEETLSATNKKACMLSKEVSLHSAIEIINNL